MTVDALPFHRNNSPVGTLAIEAKLTSQSRYNFVVRHRIALLVIATGAVAIALFLIGGRDDVSAMEAEPRTPRSLHDRPFINGQLGYKVRLTFGVPLFATNNSRVFEYRPGYPQKHFEPILRVKFIDPPIGRVYVAEGIVERIEAGIVIVSRVIPVQPLAP